MLDLYRNYCDLMRWYGIDPHPWATKAVQSYSHADQSIPPICGW